MEDPAATRIGAHGLCVVEGKLLLVRLAPSQIEAGMWTLPGGGLDWGESPERGVVRELREETGLDVEVDHIAGVFSCVFERTAERDLPALHFVSCVYWLRASSADLLHERDGSTDLAAWVPLQDVAALPLVGLARFGLALLRERASE
ncbi:MAG: NUDIX domain-containing protein [Polyangiales bacterium]